MAVNSSDGFDSYAATADLLKRYSQAAAPWTWNATAGRTGGPAIVATSAASTGVLRTRSGGSVSSTAMCVAFWFKCSAAPASNVPFWQSLNAGGGETSGLYLLTTGVLSLTSAGTFAIFGSTNICDNNWHWLEAKIVPGFGFQQMRIDNVQEWNVQYGNGMAGIVGDAHQFVSLANRVLTIDDFFLYDDATGTPTSSNYPLGAKQITTARPDGDSAVSFLTATGGGTHFNQVNETVADGDTSYVESAVSGDQDLYDYAAIGVTPSSITAVVASAFVENPNPGTINFKQICKSNATQTDGSSILVPSNYQIVQQPFSLDPNTGAAWANAAAIDAAKFGVKVA